MKKLTALLSFFILLTAFTCENESLEDDFIIDDGTNSDLTCDEATLNTGAAAQAFASATNVNYTQLCVAYKAALTAQITACGDPTSALQATIDSLEDCTVTDGGNGSAFAMTFKLNGTQYNVNNPFGNNEASGTTIFSDYPAEDFILLQGRNGLVGEIEVNLWIKRDQLATGTYMVDADTDGAGTTTHIDLINNGNNESENTISGSVTIDFVDLTAKVVRGTFEFDTADSFSEVVNFNVTEGTFDYVYDVN